MAAVVAVCGNSKMRIRAKFFIQISVASYSMTTIADVLITSIAAKAYPIA